MEVARRREGMGHNDVHALTAIVAGDRAGDPLTPSTLRARVLLSASATTTVIDRLVGKGLVERRERNGDARMVALVPTQRGSELGPAMFEALNARTMDVLESHPPDHTALVLSVVRELTDAARRAQQDVEALSTRPTAGPPRD